MLEAGQGDRRCQIQGRNKVETERLSVGRIKQRFPRNSTIDNKSQVISESFDFSKSSQISNHNLRVAIEFCSVYAQSTHAMRLESYLSRFCLENLKFKLYGRSDFRFGKGLVLHKR